MPSSLPRPRLPSMARDDEGGMKKNLPSLAEEGGKTGGRGVRAGEGGQEGCKKRLKF